MLNEIADVARDPMDSKMESTQTHPSLALDCITGLPDLKHTTDDGLITSLGLNNFSLTDDKENDHKFAPPLNPDLQNLSGAITPSEVQLLQQNNADVNQQHADLLTNRTGVPEEMSRLNEANSLFMKVDKEDHTGFAQRLFDGLHNPTPGDGTIEGGIRPWTGDGGRLTADGGKQRADGGTSPNDRGKQPPDGDKRSADGGDGQGDPTKDIDPQLRQRIADEISAEVQQYLEDRPDLAEKLKTDPEAAFAEMEEDPEFRELMADAIAAADNALEEDTVSTMSANKVNWPRVLHGAAAVALGVAGVVDAIVMIVDPEPTSKIALAGLGAACFGGCAAEVANAMGSAPSNPQGAGWWTPGNTVNYLGHSYTVVNDHGVPAWKAQNGTEYTIGPNGKWCYWNGSTWVDVPAKAVAQ